MNFPPFDFSRLGEADVREEIVAPLVRHLGYRTGAANDVIREQTLSYPSLSLGRKKASDPPLRGRADYICEAQGKVRWVIEAKAPGGLLDNDALEQSWAYANHPEVRAVYFVLTNGQEFHIYQTNQGPTSTPIFRCTYEELPGLLSSIENILSPQAVLRDHPATQPDIGPPIASGLRSVVRATAGRISYTENSLDLQPLNEMVMTITSGSLERNDHGTLEAYIETLVPFQSLQRLNEKLGLHSLRLSSDHESLSNDPSNPTVLRSSTRHVLPAGEMVLDLTSWQEVPVPMNMHVTTETTAVGYWTGDEFIGDFHASMSYAEVNLVVKVRGLFEVCLS